MATAPISIRPPTGATCGWALELDAEVDPAKPAVTAGSTRVLADLLARIPGVTHVGAEPRGRGRSVRSRLTVEARSLPEAAERAAAFLQSCALAAGLGHLVLVESRWDCGFTR